MTMIECPICEREMPDKHVNQHLDSSCQWMPLIPLLTPNKLLVEQPKQLETVNNKRKYSPLADQVRPNTLAELTGQADLIALLTPLVQVKKIPSMILWGQPGSGKTTIARLLAKELGWFYQELSATTAGLADVRKAAEKATKHAQFTGQRCILFLDEIHRFTKAQQDFFLSPLESGQFTLIAATTENPSFRINAAVLSRTTVFTLQKHSPMDLTLILKRALGLLGMQQVSVPDNVLEYISNISDGDARAALNCLEMTLDSSDHSLISIETVQKTLQKQPMLYDQDGEEHYNIISALHKSMRGSDENAALYWLGRMIYAGEDPLYVARRLVRFASEDVGMADAHALVLAHTTYQSCQVIGMPECDVILAHCVTYLARAPKSVEVYKAMKKVKEEIDHGQAYPVPLHLRNAPTVLMDKLGYGHGYKYNPDYSEPVQQSYLPKELLNKSFF